MMHKSRVSHKAWNVTVCTCVPLRPYSKYLTVNSPGINSIILIPVTITAVFRPQAGMMHEC